MFELEVNHAHLKPSDVSGDIKAQFNNTGADIKAVALLSWEEHCSECAMPQCYQTCDLYQMRKDGKCRRFVDGISPIYDVSNLQNCIVKISFKRWADLLTYSNCCMYRVGKAKFLEHFLNYVAEQIAKIPDQHLSILGRRGISSRLMLRLKRRFSVNGFFADRNLTPNYFFAEIYNPNFEDVNVSISMRNIEGEGKKIPFQKLLTVKKGFNRFMIPYKDIAQQIDTKATFTISFNPNITQEAHEGLVLYFGLNTFVTDNNYDQKVVTDDKQQKKKTVKILIWDLDNTMWDGILIEDGPNKLKLKPNVIDIIKELDNRGIVNGVVSKNNPDDALNQLERFGIKEFIVFPKISWGPKGEAVKDLIQEFNVGEDTIAFIDDSPFEREQVKATNPKVRVYCDDEYLTLLDRPEFNPILSSESSKRRYFYLAQGERNKSLVSFSGGYADFIKNCNIKLIINTASPKNIDRIHELVQRTNQMNFSGNRYTREQIATIIGSGNYDHYCMECNDKFGDYGVIGFCLIDKEMARLIDLMFSCRVQSKRIEHAFLIFLMNRYKSFGFQYLEAEYIKSDRNQQAANVFTDLEFRKFRIENNKYIYRYNFEKKIAKNNLIEVIWQGKTL